MKRYVIWMLVALASGAVHATGYLHNADALEKLRLAYDRNDPEIRATYFRGYVAGVADSTHGHAWCAPGKLDAEKIYGVVSQYLKGRTATTEQDAVALVTAALSANFPCKSQ